MRDDSAFWHPRGPARIEDHEAIFCLGYNLTLVIDLLRQLIFVRWSDLEYIPIAIFKNAFQVSLYDNEFGGNKVDALAEFA